MICDKEDLFTSTGVKFWRHRLQMGAYREGKSHSIISTHISPEGSCNLRCSYCSVYSRNQKFRIPLEVIKDYILKLKTKGLLAVIITGGGEPLLYPKINELISWLLYDAKLSVGLITNGTVSHLLHVWENLSWVRVSLNQFPDWRNIIQLPRDPLKNTIIGTSRIYTNESVEQMRELVSFSKNLGARYFRVCTNCLLKGQEFTDSFLRLICIAKEIGDGHLLLQHKIPCLPRSKICHQAYFRPYLSEVDGGTVYPCDSLVDNEAEGYFLRKYQICKAADVLDFLDRKILPHLDIQHNCIGCTFTNNINMLEDWVHNKIDRFNEFDTSILHEEFV